MSRPFLKWVGGKRQLLPVILPLVPATFGRYHERFVGGGALFFKLHELGRIRKGSAVLSDANERLIRTYRGVRDHPYVVITLLESYPHTLEFFQEVRTWAIDTRTDAEVAAWFIYLNRTGFNGLYRVNRQGRFNVPFGRYTNPRICDADGILAASAALAGVELLVQDFETATNRIRVGDFAYFDPPYVPLTTTANFTGYTERGFSLSAQLVLRDVVKRIKKRGVHVLVSNSSAPAVRRLYRSFDLLEVPAARVLSCKGDDRRPVLELLIR